MKIGLFFGSFNPIHMGHLIIAEHMATRTDLDQVWIVVSPQNPLKPKSSLANDYDRLHLVELAIKDNSMLRTSNIEFSLPKPSYTVDTLAYISEKHPQHEFCLIMGGDNLEGLYKWKNFEHMIENYSFYVYSRPGSKRPDYADNMKIHFAEAAMMNISASYVRKSLKAGQSIRYLVPDPVFQYLDKNPIYDRL